VRTLAVLLLLGQASMGNAAADESLQSRPDPDGTPTRVEVGLYIIDISQIDGVGQSFTADCVLQLRWKDPRITGQDARFTLDQVWHPNVEIYNLRSHDKMFDEFVAVLPDGTVQYTQKYHAELASPIDYHDFPFDSQGLSITLVSFGNRPDEVELIADTIGREETFSVPGWTIEQRNAVVSTVLVNQLAGAGEVIERPRLDLRFEARRQVHYYRWKALVPLSIIVALSWAVFWIDPVAISAQIGVAATSILTMIAFLLSLENIVPPVAYLTRLDKFVFACLALVFLAYVEAVATIWLARLRENRTLVNGMDRWSRALFPIVYAVVVIVCWAV